jgi:hypothetical protein
MAEGEVTITVRPNGPFRVEGPIKLVNTDGTLIDLAGKPPYLSVAAEPRSTSHSATEPTPK